MYPVMLSVEGRDCLVVGGGAVALRKVSGLLAEGAQVTVIAPETIDELDALETQGRLRVERREYVGGEAADYQLVFATTDDRAVNRRVSEDARRAGVWVNVADDPELCSFHLPARIRRGHLQVAIASEGTAPFAVRHLRRLLERRFGEEWSEWTAAAAEYRGRVHDAGLDSAGEHRCWERWFAETVDPERLQARVPSEEEMSAWIERAGRRPRRADAPTPAATEPVRTLPERGWVSLVGAGPGAPDLLTLRGWRRLHEADVVVYDRLAAGALPADLSETVELHPVGKTAGHHPVPQPEINALLVRLASEGRHVVRLKGGDPFVFGRGGEEADDLVRAGIPFEVIPGVTSGIAGPGWAGIPVTCRAEAVRVTLVTAHECSKSGGPQARWDLIARDPHATVVGYMGVSSLPRVVDRLLAEGLDPRTPAAMVERATTAGQRVATAPVARLPQVAKERGIRPPALFVIGRSVARCEPLDWWTKLPLAGQRLMLGPNLARIEGRLSRAGAEVVVAPLPLTPAGRVVLAASPLTGCVFSTPGEVDLIEEERENPGLAEDPTAWCLGSPAAQRARERGWARVVELGGPDPAGELIDEMAANSVPA